jgi:hypothetical protein
MKVVRRETLLKLGKQDKLILVNNFVSTDDECIRMRNVSIPVRVGAVPDTDEETNGFWYVPESDFKTKAGRAWENMDGTITMIVQKEKSMTFRLNS